MFPVKLAQVKLVVYLERGDILDQWMLRFGHQDLVFVNRRVGHELAAQYLHKASVFFRAVDHRVAGFIWRQEAEY